MASPRSSGTAGRDSPNPSFNEPFQFDEQKLLSNAANPEKQELYVFNWLANLERELKRTDKPLIVRLEAINTITRTLEGAAKGATELLVKDIMKQLKAGLNDKALIIKDATIKMVRVLDGSNQTIRRSVAAYISTLLEGTQGEVDFLASSTPNKNKTSTTSHPNTHSSQTPGSPTLSSSPDPVKVVLSVEEMLSHLSSIYNKHSAREVRSAIIEAYSALFIKLGTKYVELNYAEIARHLLKELVSHPKNMNSRYDTLNVREHCGLLLRDVIVTAVRELVQNWVKQWPASTHNQVEPTKLSLVCAVNEISGLLLDLGGAASTVSDVLVDPLINLLSHPTYSVQIAAAWCLRCLCYSLPVKLSELITKVLSFVNKDLNNLTTHSISSDLPKRALGHAYGLAALLSVVPARPLYVSFELSARVFSISTQLIKSSTNKDIAIASIHLQVAWILIGSLMCLGPNFVKLHLPQLLLLWKTALPKPVSKDFVSNRTESELAFMLHVRECVLGAMLSCVLHNSKLITPDVAKRLVALLSNTLAFSTLVGTSFHNVNTQSNSTTSVAQQLPSTSLKFSDREIMLKRRILQCFVAIRPISSYDNLSSQLLKMCLSNFADPEKNIGSAITAAIAAVSGSFTNVWTTGDEYAYGVSSRLQGMTVDIANVIDSDQGENSRGVAVKDWLNRDLIESRLENQLEQPIIGAPEYDSIMIYTTYWISPVNSVTYQIPKPVPAASALVDYSIDLFALIFPLQSALVQESYLEQLIKAVRHPKLEKSPGRKMALQVNMVICLLAIFKNIMNISGKKGEASVPSIADKKVGALAMELLQEAIVHPDAYLRHAASDALGRLLSVVGGNMVPTQMQLLVDQVVNNRDPDTRAGSALALGSIYSHVGGMAAGGHLKTLIGILLSLSSDPHPIVHFWALHALAKIIDSAGPMFSQYVSSTLGIIAKLYMADTHEPCGGTVGTTNVGSGLSAYQQFGKIIYGLIGTLGPELQTNSKVRNLCLNLVIELRNDDDQFVVVESIRCLQHFIMLAQQYVDLPRLVAFLQFQFSSMHFPLKEVAITCLYQLVQRNAKHVFEIAAPGLDNQLFSLLDTDPKVDGVKDIVKSWLSQTALESPSSWVELCRKVMSKTGSVASAGAPIEPPTLDITGDGGDEDEGFGIEQSSGVNVAAQRRRSLEKKTHLSSDTVQIPPRWRTQLFALQCLHHVVEIIHASGDKDHFDLAIAKKGKQAGKDYLVLKVAELIKMAFTASTAVVGEMRLEGLTLLRDLIEKFSATPDPDFEEAALLEQYQAQIGAALTPAFTADSSPEILSAAVKVCAVFVGSGIVKELHRMGRILKLLTTALANCKDNSSVTKVGDFKDLSPHAAIMVKLSVLNAWAELQVASTKQTYLVQVVQPNLPLLCPLWISTLKEYARVQIEPDITDAQANIIGTGPMQSTSQTEVFDSMYSGLVQKENPYIIFALNGEEITTNDNTNDINKCDDDEFDDFGDGNNEVSDDFTAFSHEKEPEFKKEPAKYFFILFGLCVEALSNTFGGSSRSSGIGNKVENNVENQKIVRTCIDALKAFLRPVVAGNTFLDEYIFIELINLFDRLVLTEGFK
ncbi:6771_t:CDS:10, partial [Racocetra fulgida]